MNHKQKIGYTILGAFIMLIGMSIDNLTSSPVTAQTNGEITCKQLTFVDETGKPLFYLEAGDWLSIFQADVLNLKTRVSENKEVMRLTCNSLFGNELRLFNLEGKKGVTLDASSQLGNSVIIFNDEGKEAVSLESTSDEFFDTNRVRVFNNEGEKAVSLGASAIYSPTERKFTSKINSVYVYNTVATLFDFGDGRTRRAAKEAVGLWFFINTFN